MYSTSKLIIVLVVIAFVIFVICCVFGCSKSGSKERNLGTEAPVVPSAPLLNVTSNQQEIVASNSGVILLQPPTYSRLSFFQLRNG